MGFLYPHHPRDRDDLFPVSSLDDYRARLPDRPAPTAKNHSRSATKDERRRNRRLSEVDTRDDERAYSRRDRREPRTREEDASRSARRRTSPGGTERERRPRRERTPGERRPRSEGLSDERRQKSSSPRKHRRESTPGAENGERRRREVDPEREARREARRIRRAEREARRRAEEDRLALEEGDESAGKNEGRPQPPARAYTGSSIPSSGYDSSREQDGELSSRDGEQSRAHGDDSMPPQQPNKDDNSSYRPTLNPRPKSYESDEWTVDLEKSYDDERDYHSRNSSAYDELSWYKRTTMPDPHSYRRNRRCCCDGISRRKKWFLIGGIIGSVALLIIIIAAAVAVSHKHKYSYSPSLAQVNNSAAFTSGGASNASVNSTSDGNGAGKDAYTYYSGNASSFPPSSQWVSFDAMWKANLNAMQNSCTWLNAGPDNSPQDIQDIYDAIQNRANASLVDHRFILATILQESHGCVRVGSTKSSGGVRNPGLMQSHNGHAYDSSNSAQSILAMVQDGTQGTMDGNGLVQNLNSYGNPYMAARGYNSGYIPTSGNLSEAAGATACYVSDIANRLTGWVTAQSGCSDSS